LLVRSRHSAFTSEVVAIGLDAAIGGFVLVLALVRHLGPSYGVVSALLVVLGLAVVGVGAGLCLLTPQSAGEPPRGPGRPGPKKRSTMDVFGVLATMAMAPLAIGVFGVFGKLLTMGRDLF
jgi:hypothetical protein